MIINLDLNPDEWAAVEGCLSQQADEMADDGSDEVAAIDTFRKVVQELRQVRTAKESGTILPRSLRECLCDDCGNGMEVFYDTANDYYLCDECLRKEDEQISEEEEDET